MPNWDAPFWEWEREYEGETVLIVGGGPSHGTMDLNIAREFNLIAVNSACRKVQEIAKERDILYFTDNSWAENYEYLIRGWPGRVVGGNRNAKVRLGNLINRLNVANLSERLQIKSDYVFASSGHTSAALIALMGAKRIVLIGFECQEINGRSHGHNDYSHPNLPIFKERYLPSWSQLAFKFKEMGVEVINSTPESLIKDFPFKPLNKELIYV